MNGSDDNIADYEEADDDNHDDHEESDDGQDYVDINVIIYIVHRRLHKSEGKIHHYNGQFIKFLFCKSLSLY